MLIPTSGTGVAQGKGEKVRVRCVAPAGQGRTVQNHQSCITVTQARPSLVKVPFLKTFLHVRSQVHLRALCPILHRLLQEPEFSVLQRCLKSSCCRCSISYFPFLLGCKGAFVGQQWHWAEEEVSVPMLGPRGGLRRCWFSSREWQIPALVFLVHTLAGSSLLEA